MAVEMQLQVVASLLHQGRTLDRLSTSLMLLGLAAAVLQLTFLAPVPIVLVLSAWLIPLGLLQKYWALRVAFDAQLFTLMASDTEALPARTQALDLALHALGLQRAEHGARPWPERQRGALKLLRIQALLVAAQFLPVAATLLTAPWFLVF